MAASVLSQGRLAVPKRAAGHRLCPIRFPIRFPVRFGVRFPVFCPFGRRRAAASNPACESPALAAICDPRLSCSYRRQQIRALHSPVPARPAETLFACRRASDARVMTNFQPAHIFAAQHVVNRTTASTPSTIARIASSAPGMGRRSDAVLNAKAAIARPVLRPARNDPSDCPTASIPSATVSYPLLRFNYAVPEGTTDHIGRPFACRRQYGSHDTRGLWNCPTGEKRQVHSAPNKCARAATLWRF